MILREFRRLDGPVAGSVEIELPLAVPVTGGSATISAGDRDGRYRLVLDRRVDPSALRLKPNTGIRSVGSDVEIPKVEVDRAGVEGSEEAGDIAAVLSFLTDQPFTLYTSDEDDELVPETPEDEALLQSFGTRDVWHELTGRPSVRTFSEPVTSQLVAELLPKHVGLQLYADTLRHASGSARYRDLWQVLESAFGLQDDELIAALVAYKPAIELGFTKDELEDLHVLRGRASHAGGRKGIVELRGVRSGTLDQEARLKTLVERVLMTKKRWGSRSRQVEELSPLRGWVGALDPGGRSRIVLVRRPAAVLCCANCRRNPRCDENPDEWRAESDGVGELMVFCPQCWEREFGDGLRGTSR